LGPGIYFFESQPGFDELDSAEWWAVSYKNYYNKVFDMFGSKKYRLAFGSRLKQKFLEKHIQSGG
jgi:hypothetical protein